LVKDNSGKIVEKEKIDIELKSEVLNEVLNAPPSWLIRSGNKLFFIVIVLIISLCFLISYPDEIAGEVSIYSNRPPIEFQNQMYGQLVDLQVKDQQFIRKGTVLAQFNHITDPKNIRVAQSFITKVEKTNARQKIDIDYELEHLDLGSLQQQWTNLFALIHESNSILRSNILAKKVKVILSEIEQRKRLQKIAIRKLKLIEKEIELQKNQILSSQRLLSKNVISKEEFLKEQKVENQLQQQLENQNEAIIQNDIEMNQLMKSLNETDYEAEQQLQKLQSSIQSNCSALKISLNDWERNTAWVAPFDGRVLFNKQLTVSNFYKPGEASLVIAPCGILFTGLMKVPSYGAGKIKQGQKIFIELTDYAKNEYGMLEGKVKSVTSISKNGMYEVEILMPKQLISTYNKIIPQKAVLKGNGKIITKDKRLIQRFFDDIINMINK
jgi:multidrug resistance efflux pump